jgi:hypothetical protein
VARHAPSATGLDHVEAQDKGEQGDHRQHQRLAHPATGQGHGEGDEDPGRRGVAQRFEGERQVRDRPFGHCPGAQPDRSGQREPGGRPRPSGHERWIRGATDAAWGVGLWALAGRGVGMRAGPANWARAERVAGRSDTTSKVKGRDPLRTGRARWSRSVILSCCGLRRPGLPCDGSDVRAARYPSRRPSRRSRRVLPRPAQAR